MGSAGVAGSVAAFPWLSGCECSIWLVGLGPHPLRLLLSADPRGRHRPAPRHRATCLAIWPGSRLAVRDSRRALSLRPEPPSEAMADHPGRAGRRPAVRAVAAPIGTGEVVAHRRGGRGCGLRGAVVRHLPRRARWLYWGSHARAAARHVASGVTAHPQTATGDRVTARRGGAGDEGRTRDPYLGKVGFSFCIQTRSKLASKCSGS
jgi:hypothetical protein